MKKRALLLSGGVNVSIDHPRYRNDIVAYYRLLTEVAGYQNDDIRLYVGSGAPIRLETSSSQWVLQVHPARPQQVREGLEWLAELAAEDRMVFMTTDHGEANGISLWGKNNYLTPQALTSTLDQSSAAKILVFGQCYSGVFGLNAPRNSVVCTACTANEISRPRRSPMPGVEPQYDEFLYHFAGALAGEYPDGQPLAGDVLAAESSPISIKAAFEYARAMDAWYPNSYETPQLFDPDNLAAQLRL